jgi:hypothetical protein
LTIIESSLLRSIRAIEEHVGAEASWNPGGGGGGWRI